MKRISIFCGSGDGFNDLYRETAFEVGATLAAKGIGIIYGGSRMGLMGAVADGAFQNGGEVIGIIPNFLKVKEAVNNAITQLIVVDTMHQRKLKMHEMSDGVITLAGGWGTMDELFEMLTWGQLGLHNKPIGVLNTNGFYDPLIAQFDIMVQEGFLKECTMEQLITDAGITELMDKMEQYNKPAQKAWINKQTT